MAQNKTQPAILSVTAFIETLPDQSKQVEAKTLVKLMKAVTNEQPKMWGSSIIGFGSRHYKYESGHKGDMPLACFSPRKAATVLYGLIAREGAEALLAKLGKYTTGKGCLYIKKLADVDLKVLEALVRKSVAAKKESAALNI